MAPDHSAPLTGLFYGGGTTVLVAQMIGSAIITTATFSVALALMYAVKAMGFLRVELEGEIQGLDLFEHGIPAYPEYALYPSATPQGARNFTEAAFDSVRAPAAERAR
jgi:Amt family ammonium transporter